MRRTILAAAAMIAAVLATGDASAGATGRAVQLPPTATRFDYQIGGAYRPARGVRIVDRDRAASPARGRYSICYVNAFQTQPEEATYWRTRHPDLLVRQHLVPVQDPGWPGEYLLDTSTMAHRATLMKIIGSWIDGCARKGFRAVEPDNLDSWTRSKGQLSRSSNLAYARLLIARAHRNGLAIGQKNAVEVARAGRGLGFDFAIAEECQVYGECAEYHTAYGDHVIEIEYTDNPRRAFAHACATRRAHASIILRDRDVVRRGRKDYHYEWC